MKELSSDGTNGYFNGIGRLGEERPAGWVCCLGDTLGSVRQLADPVGAVAMARSYEPFGETLDSAGTRTTNFQFTGQQVDATGLVFLRARYLEPAVGRFLSRDVWEGDPDQPMSYNAWLYVEDNPVNGTDPSGRRACEGPSDECEGPPRGYTAPRLQFERLQVEYGALANAEDGSIWIQWFGATQFAARWGADLGYTEYCRGYHCGIDLGAPYGTAVHAGVHAYVAWAPSDRILLYQPDWRDAMRRGEEWWSVLYQHTNGVNLVGNGSVVSPDTVVSGVGGGEGNYHIHIEVRYGEDYWKPRMMNPLLYYLPSDRAVLSSIARRQVSDLIAQFSVQFLCPDQGPLSLLRVTYGPGILQVPAP
jgi:RHS repeat-associated protein